MERAFERSTEPELLPGGGAGRSDADVDVTGGGPLLQLSANGFTASSLPRCGVAK